MKATFINTLTELMKQDDNIVTITADMGFSVFEDLQKQFPQRFINTGVTEQASASIAAGMALSGYTVFFYAQAAFATMRCFEQLHLDVAYNKLNIKIIGVNAGYSLNQLGVSHFSVEDVGIMRTLPGMTIFSPGTPQEMKWAMEESCRIDGPTYLRYTKLQDADLTKPPVITLGNPVEIRKGKDAVLFTSGGIMRFAKEVTDLLKKKGIDLQVYSVPTIKPLDAGNLLKLCKNKKMVFTLEEHSIIGGLGSAVAELLAETPGYPALHRFGIQDRFIGVTGSMKYLLSLNGLSPEAITEQIILSLKNS